MAYEKTLWIPRSGSNLNRFEKERETSSSVILHNVPSSLEKQGTKFSPDNMNKIEQGIYDAHEMIAAETAQRKITDDLLQQAIEAEVQDRQSADALLQQAIKAETETREFAVSVLQTAIDLIKGLIPNQASFDNLLADRNFVNSTLSNTAAWFLTPDSSGEEQWSSLEALRAGPWYSGGIPRQPIDKDYAIFINQDPNLGPVNSVWRASFSNNLWSPQYKVNDTPFTAAQLAAINSDITAALVDKLKHPDTEPVKDSENIVTSGGVITSINELRNKIENLSPPITAADDSLIVSDDTIKINTMFTVTNMPVGSYIIIRGLGIQPNNVINNLRYDGSYIISNTQGIPVAGSWRSVSSFVSDCTINIAVPYINSYTMARRVN